MKIYQVIYKAPEGEFLNMGLFSTKEKAKNYIKEENDGTLDKEYCIQEIEVQ